MEMVPRIARAQRLDVLSSQASLAGYKAVLMASNTIGRFFPLMMTAAGTIPPATVVILGAGVAGLQAIATAKRLGAKVQAFDVRSVVREQVESLGAEFIDIEVADAEDSGGYARELTEQEQEQQTAALGEYVAKADVVITTAQIPGRPAPVLVKRGTVEAMREGSVIVDLAAETGGNVEGTVAGENVEVGGVTIVGPVNVPASMPEEASVLYSRNLQGLLELIVGEEGLALDFEDEVVAGTVVTHDGKRAGQLAS
jgi:NAD(P) transhydrogenase subunit alpha